MRACLEGTGTAVAGVEGKLRLQEGKDEAGLNNTWQLNNENGWQTVKATRLMYVKKSSLKRAWDTRPVWFKTFLDVMKN